MIVHAKLSALKQAKWYEYALRFVLGGAATAFTGFVAKRYGPITGGLFLAFPAIFCASATLIESHERQRKQKYGLKGDCRGKQAAALDSAGAGWGSIALGVFGACVWLFAINSPVASLLAASVLWLAVAILMWRVRRVLRRTIVLRTFEHKRLHRAAAATRRVPPPR